MGRSRLIPALVLAIFVAGCFKTPAHLTRGGDVSLPAPRLFNMIPQATVGCTKVPTTDGPLGVRQTGDPPSSTIPSKCLSADSLRRMGNRVTVAPVTVP